MAGLIYQSLHGIRNIRIMELEAGADTEQLRCCLREETLTMSLAFQALSYEWKTDCGLPTISCDGAPLTITCNLAIALRTLRQLNRSLSLWVDAICINQNDEQEKSEQVRLMRDIYASAKSVLVWLGPGEQNVAEAFDIFLYLARLAVERHPTGRPDTASLQQLIESEIIERPAHGSILKAGQIAYITHDRDTFYTKTLPSSLGLDDDHVFRFGESTVWTVVDELFGSSYFYRSWIVQEIGVAEGVVVMCGHHKIEWDLFHLAYQGRLMLRFMTPGKTSNVICVRDARHRYRSFEVPKCFDLAVVLASFTNSRESDARDRIYAALGLVKPPNVCQEVVPDYTKSVSDVFYTAACHIIPSRQDLYLWSSKTLRCRRTLQDLPSWVPEWTMPACEEAIEFASLEFSRCLSGHYSIRDRSLFVDSHVLDEVDEIFQLDGPLEIIDLITRLRRSFDNHQRSLFDPYPSIHPGTTNENIHTLQLQDSHAESTALLSDYDDIPTLAVNILKDIKEKSSAASDDTVLNIEAIWLTLSSTWHKRGGRSKRRGYHLLLAVLYLYSILLSGQHQHSMKAKVPESYTSWFLLALLLHIARNSTLLSDMLMRQREVAHNPGYIHDCFFITRKGLFGRAPAEVIRSGHIVAVIGGAWVPCLLQRREHHFELVSHAYVEGIMSMDRLPADCKVQRIELR